MSNYANKCQEFSDAIKNRVDSKHNPTNWFLHTYNYEEYNQKEHEESDNKPLMPSLESDEEEVKEEEWLKLLTSKNC